MDTNQTTPEPNAITGKILCTYPVCVEARTLGRRNAHLFWTATVSWIVSITMAVWINMREPTISALRVENAKLQGQVLYLQGRLTLEGVIDEIARVQKAAGGSPAAYTLPPSTNLQKPR